MRLDNSKESQGGTFVADKLPQAPGLLALWFCTLGVQEPFVTTGAVPARRPFCFVSQSFSFICSFVHSSIRLFFHPSICLSIRPLARFRRLTEGPLGQARTVQVLGTQRKAHTLPCAPYPCWEY